MRSLLADSGSRAVIYQDGPEDGGPRIKYLSDSVVRAAARPHRCNGCDGGFIARGRSYQRIVMIEDGKFTFIKLCTGCSR